MFSLRCRYSGSARRLQRQHADAIATAHQLYSTPTLQRQRLDTQAKHRLNTEAQNQKGGQICITQSTQTMMSFLSGDWLLYLRPSLTASILILYLYIILITLGMTVDLHKLDTNYGGSTYEATCNLSIHTFLNMYFSPNSTIFV